MNHTRPNIKIEEINEYDIDSNAKALKECCRKADFVFNLAGINQTKDKSEFMQGNFGFDETMLNTLKKYNKDNSAQLFFGRYLMFFVISQIQGIIIAHGDFILPDGSMREFADVSSKRV